MRNYLNPTVFAYTDAEWDAFSFVGRLNDLVDFLVLCNELEEEHGRLYDLVRLRTSRSLMDFVYLLNPFMSQPGAAPHYQTLYRSRILPELLRRFDYCPTGPCGALAAVPLPAPVAPPGASALLQSFVDECALCAMCGSGADATLITHADAEALPPAGFFRHSINLDHPDVVALADPVSIFPWVECDDQDQRVTIAIEAALGQRRLTDATWNQYTASPLQIQPSFWRSLRQADFGELEMHYKQRIISCLTQLACGRSVDTQEHRMIGMQVNHGGANYQKWNAYVFQMTAGPQDRRCSRIYFARTGAGIVLNEYDPDAH